MSITHSRILFVFVLLAGKSHVALTEEQAVVPTPVAANISTTVSNIEIGANTQSSPDEDIQRLFTLYMDARNTGMVDEAEVIAKQIVELSITAYGYDSRQTSHALTDLGELQTSSGNYHAAILNLVAAVEIIERIDNRLSISLVSPLRALGYAHLQSGDSGRALNTWNHAVHVSHVNLGPHNYDQVETLASISRLLAAADKHKEANKIRRRIYNLSRRNIDETYRSGSGLDN